MKAKPKHKPPYADDGAGPTPERARHGAIERLDHAIADEDGRPARPYRGLDTLGLMLRRGSISPGVHHRPPRISAPSFPALVWTRCLSPIWRACRRDRAPPRRRCRTARPRRAPRSGPRSRRWAAWRRPPVHACGMSWGPKARWKEWAQRQGWGGRASPETAAGILVGALGTLQAYFGLA